MPGEGGRGRGLFNGVAAHELAMMWGALPSDEAAFEPLVFL